MPIYDPFGVNGGGSTTTSPKNYTGGTRKSNAGRTYDPFNIGSIDAVPNPDAKPAATKQQNTQQPQQQPKKSSSLFDKVKTGAKATANFVDNNVVKPAVNTGKAVGNAGAVVAGTVTGNQKATSNAKQAYNKSYEQSIPNMVTSPTEGLIREDIVDPAKVLTAQVTGNKKAQANAQRQQAGDSTLRKTVSNSVGTILNVAAPGIGKFAAKTVGENLVKKGASEFVAKRAAGAAAGTAIGTPMGANSVIADENTPLTVKNVLKGAGSGLLTGGLLGGMTGEQLANHNETKLANANAKQAMQTAAQNHLLNTARAVHDDLHDNTLVTPETAGKHAAATPEHVSAVNDLMANAQKADPVFQRTMSRVADDHGLEYHPGPVKSADRTFDKVMTEYGGDHTQVKDSVRGTITLHDHSPKAIQAVVDKVGEQMRVLNVKNLYKKFDSGYRDVKLTVETPTGHKGEIILATPEMLQAKHELGGHELYQIARDESRPAEDRALAGQQMRALYNQAHEVTNKRLASSSDLPATSTKNLRASSSDTLSEPGGSAPTSLVTPETTTVSRTSPAEAGRTASSTSSGVTKNVAGGSESVIPSSIADNSEHVNNKSTTTDSGSTTKPVPAAEVAPAGKRSPAATATKVKESAASPEHTPLKPSQTAHMPEIGGYTHSQHMMTEYADMLREQEKQAKGGQMVEDNSGPGTPTYTRTSEHSKFYRDYYKENGKPPTKPAYLEEAKRQLESGHAAYGASEDYKALVEREHQPIPKMDINTTPVETGGKTKKSKLATGVEAKAIRAKLTKSLGDLPEYSTVNMEKQAQYAADLLKNDPEKATAIALGHDTPPNHILPESVYVAVENKALADGDAELIKQLATSSRVGEASVMGQRIRALAERNPDSAVSAVKTLSDARTKAFERRSGKTVAKAVNETTKEIKAATPKVTKETWGSFIDSLKC